MKRFTHTLIVFGAFAFAACGGDEPEAVEPGPAPDLLSRPVEGIEKQSDNPEYPEHDAPDVGRDAVAAEDEEAACCPTDFALPDEEKSDEEVSAVLLGDQPPLNVEGGIALAYSDGAWRATECIPPDYAGDYHYVVSIADENGDIVYESVRTNPNVDAGFSERGEVNLWERGGTCDEIDVSVHGLDESPDL